MADTREQSTALNGAIRDRLLAAGHLDDTHTVVTKTGERLGVGDRVATRRNDRDLGVTNRDTWTITAIGADGDHGSLTLRGRRATDLRTVPAGYAREHVELAYATTVYGAQGETTSTGHLMLGEHTSAASAYVAMTRGRDNNVAHLVAENLEDARRQWERCSAVTGPTSAPRPLPSRPPRTSSATAPSNPPAPSTRSSATCGRPGPGRPTSTNNTNAWPANATPSSRSPPSRPATHQTAERLHSDEVDARRRWLEARQRVDDLEAALTSETADLQTQLWGAWRQELSQAQRAAEVVRDGRRATGPAPATGPRRRRRPDRVRRPLAPRRARPGHRPCRARRPGDVAARAPRRRPHQRLRRPHGRRRPPGRRPDPRDRARRPRRLRAGRTVAHPPRGDHVRRAAPVRPGRAHPRRRRPTRRRRRTNWQASNATCAPPPHESMSSSASRAVRALPRAGVDGERERWAADRVARQEAAARDAKERRQRQQETRRIEPPPPSRSTPDHGRGIGR